MEENATFFARLLQVIKHEGFKTINDFAINGLKYNSSEKLRRLKEPDAHPSFEILDDIAKKFADINIHWLVTGKGYMVIDQPKTSTEGKAPLVGKSKKSDLLSEPPMLYVRHFEPGDDKHLRHIPVLDQKAAAGWPYSIDDPNFFRDQPTFTVPKIWFRSGDWVMLQVEGDSMNDTLYNGDWIFISQVDDLKKIKDGYIYVVITVDGVVVKRVINKMNDGYLVLQSDNALYNPYTVQLSDVVQIWKVERSMSSVLSNRNKQMASRLDQLEADMAIIKRQLTGRKG